MYIVKNAIKNVLRSKHRSIMIGIILFVLSFCTCIGLSIQQASNTSKDTMMELTDIEATISVDRQKIMDSSKSGGDPRENMQKGFQEYSSLSLEELETYAQLDTVNNFYYTGSLSVLGTDEFELIESTMQMPGPMKEETTSGFTLVGYSSDEAMTGFQDGDANITQGTMFTENTSAYECIISEELATYNSIEVGDTITLVNSSDESLTSTWTVTGFFETETSQSQPGDFLQQDSANSIYTSYSALEILANEQSLELQVNGTYSFKTVQDYETFQEDCYDAGLDEQYSVSSSDINQYEQSLIPLENLSTFAFYFVCVILLIGSIVLVVLNIFSIRERNHEIGILCAIGMNKIKIASQFFCETLFIALIAVLLGTSLGAVSSVPVTNQLLSTQLSANNKIDQRMENNFSRPDDMNMEQKTPEEKEPMNENQTTLSQISTVDQAINITVILELIGISLVLVFISCAAALIFILRYDPITILTNRD